MVYKLLYEYKQIYSFNNRFFKYFHKWKICLTLIIMLAVWGGMYSCSKVFSIRIPDFVHPLPMLFIPYMIFMEVKRITKEIHKVDSVKDYNEKCKVLFLNRVRMNKIDIHNKEQMEMLFTIVDDEIKELKPNFFFNKAVITGLLAPLWINYISSIYSNEVTNWQEATYILFFFLIVLTMIFIIGYQLKQVLYDDIVNSNYKNLKYMNNLLKDTYITSLGTLHIT